MSGSSSILFRKQFLFGDIKVTIRATLPEFIKLIAAISCRSWTVTRRRTCRTGRSPECSAGRASSPRRSCPRRRSSRWCSTSRISRTRPTSASTRGRSSSSSSTCATASTPSSTQTGGAKWSRGKVVCLY